MADFGGLDDAFGELCLHADPPSRPQSATTRGGQQSCHCRQSGDEAETGRNAEGVFAGFWAGGLKD